MTRPRPRLLLLLLTVALLGGCGARKVMPTPNLFVNAATDPFADVPESRRSNVVELLYATDREPEPGDGPSTVYGALRSTSLAVGVTRVRLGPEDLSWDELVSASRTDRRSRSLPLRHLDTEERLCFPASPWFVNLPDDPDYTEEAFRAEEAVVVEEVHALLAEQLALSDQKDVYVFVHGFNNTFAYAAETFAQLWHFLGRPGVAVLYSWPASRAGIFGYNVDRESSSFTVTHFESFLMTLATCDAVEEVHVLGHSRGTDVVTEAMREFHIWYNGRGEVTQEKLKLGNVVLAAADLDLDVTTQRAGRYRVAEAPRRLTVYAGAGDQALKISARMFKSTSRIGQVNPDDIEEYHAIHLRRTGERFNLVYRPRKTSFLGHGYFVDDPAVSSDLVLLLRDDLPPGAEHGRPLTLDPKGVWIIEDDYPNFDAPPATVESE